jgi:Cell wall-associated hydrolases (invasion-associated proteins)
VSVTVVCIPAVSPPRTAARHRAWPAFGLALVLCAAAGCAPFKPGLPSEPFEPVPTAARGPGTAIARNALAQLGVPYRYGGSEPRRGFDCSGLVAYTHAQEGIAVPRTAAAQFAASHRIDDDELRAGDLVFFRTVPRTREITHVGIYTGQRRFVHAPQTGRDVMETSLDEPYYRDRYAGSGRLYAPSGAGPRLKSPK